MSVLTRSTTPFHPLVLQPAFGFSHNNKPQRDPADFVVPEADHEILYRDPDNWKYFAVACKKPDPVTGQKFYHYVYRPNSELYVGIVPTVLMKNADGEMEEHVVLIETKRGLGKVEKMIEIPGGDVDNLHGKEMEEPDNVAKAELAEEVELESSQLKPVPNRPLTLMEPGLARKFANYYLARYSKTIPNPNTGDADEKHTIRKKHMIPVSQVYAWLDDRVKEGYGVGNIVYAGLFYLMQDMGLMLQGKEAQAKLTGQQLNQTA